MLECKLAMASFGTGVISVKTDLHIGQPGFDSYQGQGFFCLPPCSYWICGHSCLMRVWYSSLQDEGGLGYDANQN